MSRDLLASPLADRYRMEAIVTWRGFQPTERLMVFCRALVSLTRWCLGTGRRVVHIHTAVRGSLYRKALCISLARCLRRPVLLQIHAGPGDIEAFASGLGARRRWMFRRALRSASRVAAVSAGTAMTMERLFGIDGVELVPNAAPIVPADIAEDVGTARTVLYLGGFANPVKGGSAMIEAIESCAETLPGVEFVLGGPGDAPDRLVELENRARNVRWAGYLDEAAKRQAFAHCAVFVLPSLSEGLPIALLEAMAWGRAIVATAVGGVPDTAPDGTAAIVVPPDDPASIVVAIEAAMSDPDRRRELGEAARRRALDLNDRQVYGHLGALYAELAG